MKVDRATVMRPGRAFQRVLFGGAAGLALFALSGKAAAQETGPSVAVEDAAASLEQIPGEIAIDLRDDVSAEDLANLGTRYGVVMHPNSAWSVTHDKLEVADVDPSREAGLLEALSHDPRVEHAEPMALYRATFVPNDPLYATKQWHLKRVGAEGAWRYSCGAGVVVAVVDTGIACFDKGSFSRGSDLAGTRCEGGWNFVNDSAEAADDQGHGTHVAGTIAQTTNNGVGASGLAYCATLMPVKVLTKQGFGTVANVAEGIRFAADEGAQVVNLSLGGPMKSEILRDAIEHAISRDVVVVAAAGNSGRSVGWPAAYPGVVAVSATDDADKIAWFSSRGPEVSIAAPGVAVTQQTICNGGHDKCEVFGTFNGTSMASPHVAGVAALVESLGVTRRAAVIEALVQTARTAGDGDASLYGAGVVDAAAAVSRVFWWHVVLRASALVAFAWWLGRHIRRRGRKVRWSAAAVVGALLTSVGLLPFAPLFDPFAFAGAHRTLVALASRPLGEWDIVLMGAGSHRWLLLASCIPALVLTMVGFSSLRVRDWIGGVALGTAALLAQACWSGDVVFLSGGMAGVFIARVWAAANAAVCLWLARMALDDRARGAKPR